MRLTQRQSSNFTCPSDAKWYACPASSQSQFLGCCAGTSDPCQLGCFGGNLRSATFDISLYGNIPDGLCQSGKKEFYTCKSNAFWGCCTTKPCDTGCPNSNLEAAKLPGGGLNAVYLTSEATSSPTSASTISSSTGSTLSSSSTASSTGTSVPIHTSAAHQSPNVGAIAGGAAGGVALLAIIIGWLLYHYLYARRSREIKNDEMRQRNDLQPTSAIMTGVPKATSAGERSESEYLPSYGSPKPPYSPDLSNKSQYSPNPTYELPTTQSPTYSIPRKQPPHSPRLSELSGESARVELESVRSSGANWTTHPWQASSPSTPSSPGRI